VVLLVKKIIVTALLLVLILIGFFYEGNSEEPYNRNFEFEYYEDESNQMEFDQVKDKFYNSEEKINYTGDFSFGNSTSTYWIRMKIINRDFKGKEYISIYNPTVKEAIAFLPQRDKEGYRKLSSGWGYGNHKQDERFFYPVFKMNEGFERHDYIYLKVHSKFTQNYRITFLSSDEFENIKRKYLLLYGVLFGVLIAVMIQNFVMFIQLKNRAYLFYLLYTASMMIYQGNLCGIYNVFIPEKAYGIMNNTIILSLVGMGMIVVFFREFFQTKDKLRTYDKLLKGILIIYGSSIILFSIIEQPTIANFYAHNMANIGAVIMMMATVKAFKAGMPQAKLFLLGWTCMSVSMILSLFRNLGLVSNNIITLHLVLITISLQAIFISIDLIRQYQKVESDARSYEFAFLHAQIKPHFLYNTLNVISSLCKIDSEKARETVLDLSDLLRHLFDISVDKKVISLKDEMECVKAYVRIEQIRFRNKLTMTYNIDDDMDFNLPPLVIQPLVENAIIHGIRKNKGTSHVILSIKETEEGYRIQVGDDGIGMTGEMITGLMKGKRYKEKGIGIANINKRLYELYKQKLDIKSTLGEGTTVSFLVPKGMDK
jgi:sensor histidine kinase YesM